MAGAGRLGRYELLARLAAGGMGEIFLARLEGAAGFEKLYVVKRILPHLASDPRFRKMLIAEAQIASKMAHANICQVYELGETDGQLFIVMEYLEGVALLPLLRTCSRTGQPLANGLIGSIFGQTCDAIHYAHELKDRSGNSLDVIHRDVTPANVFLTDTGVAKVLDFGIARMNDSSTQTDTVKGKYAYMAPEQLRGQKLTRRVDVFALGVVLFEMLALRRLFQRRTDFLTFAAVMEQPVADLRRYRPDVPEALVSVVMRALERDPADRWPTVRELRDATLDALPSRAWASDEVGEFVRTTFATELGRTQTAVAQSIDRTEAGRPADWMTSEAPIAAGAPVEAEDDVEFPSVETDVDHGVKSGSTEPATVVSMPGSKRATPPSGSSLTGTSLPAISLTGMSASTKGMPAIGAAMAGAAHAGVRLRPLTEAGPEELAPARPSRGGRLAILVGASFLLLGGGAAAVIYTLWPRPVEVTADVGFTTETRVIPKDTDDRAALDSHIAKLGLCTARHRTAHAAATASILIGADGRAKGTISFTPPELEGTPLAKCLSDVFHAVAFQERAAESLFVIDIALPKPRR
jgi:serine/threonine protein kinase